jgi:quercetin dioxygenase-like cupin family protein
MRAFDRGTAANVPVGVVDVARWEQFDLNDTLPFGAMWYSIPPGEQSPRDCHPEAELSLVVSGTAWVETASGVVAVDTGSAFLLEGNEAHTVHNRSSELLVVFSAYWLPAPATVATEVRSA